MPKFSLSLFFGYHDSSVTIADDSQILLHLEAERFFREKHCRIMDLQKMDTLAGGALEYVGGRIEDVEQLYLAKLGNPLPEGPLEIGGRTFDPIITTHHQNHIATVLHHGMGRTLIVVADGGSEDGSTSVYLHDSDGSVKMVENLDHTAANGKFYGSLTMLIIDPDFFRAHGWYSGKTMGLSAHGRYDERYAELLAEYTPKMLWGNVLDVAATRKAFGISDDYAKPWLDASRRDLAHTGQAYWEQTFLKELEKHSHLADNIVMVGGCALNVLLNAKLVDSGLFKNAFVGPASGDCGQSMGAILHHERNVSYSGPYLGRGFGEVDRYPEQLVPDLLSGKIVAWYQGRAEIGPRALGHRSFLGLPFPASHLDRMNQLKGREPYRPVAPMIAAEFLEGFFCTKQPSPYMSFAPRARDITIEKAPAIVHADGTSRVQTLSAEDNPILHRALVEVGQETGVPILMNTSFNVAGEAIVDTPEDAMRNFKASQADVLYINGKRIVA